VFWQCYSVVYVSVRLSISVSAFLRIKRIHFWGISRPNSAGSIGIGVLAFSKSSSAVRSLTRGRTLTRLIGCPDCWWRHDSQKAHTRREGEIIGSLERMTAHASVRSKQASANRELITLQDTMAQWAYSETWSANIFRCGDAFICMVSFWGLVC